MLYNDVCFINYFPYKTLFQYLRSFLKTNYLKVILKFFVMVKKARSDPNVFIDHCFKRWRHLSSKHRESKIVPECKLMQKPSSSLGIEGVCPNSHIEAALNCEYPIGWTSKVEHTLPHDLLAVLEIRSKFKDNSELIRNYRSSKMNELRALARSIPRESHDSSNPLAGRFHWGLLQVLSDRCKFEDSSFVERLKHGVKMSGIVEDGKGVFPNDESFKPPLSRKDLSSQLSTCTKQSKFDNEIWRETLKELSDPWPCLFGPVSFSSLVEKYGNNMIISRRFAIEQSNSLRLIDNLKKSKVNDLVATTQKLCLSTFDTLFVLAARLKEASSLQLKIIKRDQKKAYKQLFVRAEDRCLNILSVNNPSGEVSYFESYTVLFGLSSAPLTYNVFMALLMAIFRYELLILCENFFDDVYMLETEDLTVNCKDCFDELHVELLNILLKDEKSSEGEEGPHLGFIVNVNTLEILITEERKSKILVFIENILSERGLNSENLSKLAGKLSHISSKVFNRSGRPFLFPLYNYKSGHFSERLRRCLLWFHEFIHSFKSRKFEISTLSTKEKVLVYTDAEESNVENFGLGAVIISPKGRFVASHLVSRAYLSSLLIELKTKNIFSLEMLGVLFGRYLSNLIHEGWSNRNEIAFVDNEGVRLSLIKGYCKRQDIQPLVDRFWLSSTSTTLWVDRVSSENNPADAPSRGKAVELSRCLIIDRDTIVKVFEHIKQDVLERAMYVNHFLC
jgi:hypothetical protein